MARLVLFNKPFQVLSQFRDEEGRDTLKGWIDDPALRVAGRLDYDSEGLLLLSDSGQLVQQISNPRHKTWKTYWVQVEGQVEGEVGGDMLDTLRRGVELKDGPTRPAKARQIVEPPALWPRNPPIRVRQSVPTSWLEISICEGRNRQVRRMTAAVGLPTLRLVRARIGDWELGQLQPGEKRSLEVNLPKTGALRRSRRRL